MSGQMTNLIEFVCKTALEQTDKGAQRYFFIENCRRIVKLADLETEIGNLERTILGSSESFKLLVKKEDSCKG